MVFRRKGRSVFDIKLPTKSGDWVMRSTGTRDPKTAKKFQRMVDELGPEGSRAWELFEAVIGDRIGIGHLFDRWALGQLDQLRAELNDVDIATFIDEWQSWLTPRVKADTAAHYLVHVRDLMPKQKPYMRSALTIPALTKWLGQNTHTSGTVRKYHAAMSSFLGYLVQRQVIPMNLMRMISPPKAGKPRDRHVDTSKAIAIADAQPGPFRTLSALLAGTGLDVSTALQLVKGDIDVDTKQITARGTKSYNRKRVVRVAEWAWPYIERHIRTLTPSAPLFPGIDRWDASESHRNTVKLDTINEVGYTMRDARHTYAVRAARGGTPPLVIAKQLGHKDATLVLKVYGVYFPDGQEREHWEQQANVIDLKRRASNAG
jgi:integrase